MSGSGANTVRLTKINPLLGSGKKPAGGSLLNPSYLAAAKGEPGGGPPPVASSGPPAGGGFSSSSGPLVPLRSSGSSMSSSSIGGGGSGSSSMVGPGALVPLSSYSSYLDRGDKDERKRRDDSDASKRRKRSRWGGDENDKTFIPGMPTILPTNLSKDQEQAYLIQLQIEDYTRRLRSGDLGIPSNPEQRSPSPEPIYGSDGKRLNTREYRTRKRLEEERHRLIQKMMSLNTDYKPPSDYKPPATKVTDKIVIPQEDHPEINFIGLLIGPRGNTLKSLERESGAKIIIRGKGSVKEGKVGRKDGLPMPGEDEPLHALISSSNPECVKKAVDRIKEIIRQGVEVPEDQNDLRRNQLRELALLNGTLREHDGPRCNNCGATNHKSWQCPDKPNVTNNVICNACGGAGHIARDCRQRRAGGGGGGGSMGGGSGGGGGSDRAKIDEEYMSLMAELGEGPAPQQQDRDNRRSGYGTGYDRYSSGRGVFDRRETPRPLMAPLSGSGDTDMRTGAGGGSGSGSGSRPGSGWSSTSVPPPPVSAGGVRPMLNQPPPQGPPPGWGGAGAARPPPPPSSSGAAPPPPTSAAASSGVRPPASLFQGPPPGPPSSQPQGGSGSTTNGQSASGWQAARPPWQQQPPPPPPPPPGPVPPPRPVGGPAGPPPGMYSWQQQQQRRQQPDLNLLAQSGLPNLLAAPPPPPPS